jgi:hypothetical protein
MKHIITSPSRLSDDNQHAHNKYLPHGAATHELGTTEQLHVCGVRQGREWQ